MDLVFELEPSKDLTSVLLENLELSDDFLVVTALTANVVQLVVETHVFKTRQKLGLLLFGWGLVDDEVDKGEDLGAQHGLLHGQRGDQLVEGSLVALLSLVDGGLGDQSVGNGASWESFDNLVEHLTDSGADAWVRVVHELVERREEVKLALDELTNSLEVKEVRHDLEDLLHNLDERAAEALL